MEELKSIMEKFVESGWDLISVLAQQWLDEKTWNRAMHCMVFRNSVEPAFCVTPG